MSSVPGAVGGPGWALPRAPGAPKPVRGATLVLPPLALQAIPFFLLGFFAAAHWAALVEPDRTGRALLVVLICTVGGMLLAATARFARLPGIAVRVLLLLAMAVLSVGAIGIRFKLLWPSHWDTLGDRISGALSSVGAVTQWPYGGPNDWLELTTLLGVPLVLVIASAFVFWPRAKESRSAYRAFALLLLVALYGIAVAARPFDYQALRGTALLGCLAAWLWLPRLSGRDAVAALAALGIAAGAALALTPQLAGSDPWLDYRQWSWSLNRERTVAFNWQHQYGPLNWPRKGTTMLLVKSKNPHYWKAETLDRFDGRGWTTGNLGGTRVNRRVAANPKWTEKVHVTVRGLKSDLVIGPGSLLKVSGVPGEAVRTAYGTALASGVLKSGDSYDVTGYTPDPSVEQMRAAGPPDPLFSQFTLIQLPQQGGFVSNFTWIPLRGQPRTGDPDAIQALERSRYAPIYRLAQRIAAGARTDYDVVRRVGSYLQSKYTYAENIPTNRYPLRSFLLEDKRGYCQQFSGSAALMLRMLGIPVRVAAGFAPGTLDKETKEYVVRDLDAHSWIEVWFDGIGWVPFDPTPAAAPAASQAASFQPFSEIASAARGDSKDTLNAKLRAELLGADTAGGGKGGGGVSEDDSISWAWIGLGIVLALVVIAAVAVGIARRRARRRPRPALSGDAEVDHLVRLLCRLGVDVRPGTTLLEIEARVGRLGGPDAADYTRRLRERRYGAADCEPASRSERRQIRRLLAAGVGAGAAARLQLALPDNLVAPRFRR